MQHERCDDASLRRDWRIHSLFCLSFATATAGGSCAELTVQQRWLGKANPLLSVIDYPGTASHFAIQVLVMAQS